MRPFHAGFALLSAASLTLYACGQESGVAQTTSTGSSGLFDCHDILLTGPGCNNCLQEQCCSELSLCMSLDPRCFYCTTEDPESQICVDDPKRDLPTALNKCADEKCSPLCHGGVVDAGMSDSGGGG